MDAKKRIVLASALIAAAVAIVVCKSNRPANAVTQCSWGEIKACYLDPPIYGDCCPKPKDG